jgi:hypothetical protein
VEGSPSDDAVLSDNASDRRTARPKISQKASNSCHRKRRRGRRNGRAEGRVYPGRREAKAQAARDLEDHRIATTHDRVCQPKEDCRHGRQIRSTGWGTYSRLDFLVRLVLTSSVCLFSQRRGVTLHSGKNQEQREAALQSLRDGDVEVLVATDLVSNV